MKHITFCMLSCMLFVLPGYGQEEKTPAVPQPVADAFREQYPEARNARWARENPDVFEVEFSQGAEKMEAYFHADGQWMTTVSPIRLNELPQAVLETLAHQYADYRVNEASRVEDADAGLYYEVEIDNNDASTVVSIGPDGDVFDDSGDTDGDENGDDE